MSEYIINDSWINEYENNIEDLIGFDLSYDSATNPVPPLRRIVRCRDCKDYRASDATCHSWQWHNWDAAIEVEPDGFCAWAKLKEDGE